MATGRAVFGSWLIVKNVNIQAYPTYEFYYSPGTADQVTIGHQLPKTIHQIPIRVIIFNL